MGAACEAVLRDVTRLDAETVDLRDAAGRVLAEVVKSPLDLPPWDNASMDGYAVRGDDVRDATPDDPRTLAVVDVIAAGGTTTRVLQPGEAFRIMTGAPVPAGADSVIRVEDTDAGEVRVAVTSDRDVLRNVRSRGEDLRAGAVAVDEGTALHPAHVGLLASVGRGRVAVYRRPRVALLASGDELVDVDRFADVLAGQRIVNSNVYTLEAAVREAGGNPILLGTTGDDPREMRALMHDCECDLLITTGGVSVGAFDYTRRVLDEMGVEQRFWRVKMRPGAPVGFGMLHGTPWLGLPGNSVSAFVTFELFGRPAIRKMLGHRLLYRRPVRARVTEPLTISAPLTHFLRAVVTMDAGGYAARLTGAQGSGLLTSVARANGLIVVPPDRPHLDAGSSVDVLLMRDDAGHSDRPPAR